MGTPHPDGFKTTGFVMKRKQPKLPHLGLR